MIVGVSYINNYKRDTAKISKYGKWTNSKPNFRSFSSATFAEQRLYITVFLYRYLLQLCEQMNDDLSSGLPHFLGTISNEYKYT